MIAYIIEEVLIEMKNTMHLFIEIIRIRIKVVSGVGCRQKAIGNQPEKNKTFPSYNSHPLWSLLP